MNTAIYIDDTGTPEKSNSKYDPGNWKTWTAVVLNKDERQNLFEELSEMQNDLKNDWGIDEFHFTEIFSGNKQFKKIPLEVRINIFAEFAEVYKKYNFPIFIQSLTDDDIIRNKMENFRKIKMESFDFSKNEHLALFFLLIILKEDKILDDYIKPIDIYVDAGKQKPNTSQKLSILNNFASNSEIKYVDSKDEILIQFIDFIAFCINRCRWILMNNKKSKSDILLLQIASHADFNTVNIQKEIVNINDENTTEKYDEILRKKYDLNGNLSDKEVNDIKYNKGIKG